MLTAQQAEKRKSGIGGSDMSCVLGLSSYKTPLQLYLEKIGEIEPSYEETDAQYWGHLLEDTIRNEFSKRNKVHVHKPDTITHEENKFMLGNLDGFIPSLNAVLEIKCSNSFMCNEWGEDGSDKIPLQYLVQVAHYCYVTNASCAYIAVLIGGNDYREFKYERDLSLESKILERAKDFWGCVQSRTPPQPINIHDLRIMHPRHDPEKSIVTDNSILQELTRLRDIKDSMRILKGEEDVSKFNIMKHMNTAEYLKNESGQVLASWRANKNGSRTFLLK